MIFKLILKDIKVYKTTIFFRILFLWLSAGAIIIFKNFSLEAYIGQACITIVFAHSIFLFNEKKRSAEIITCSLPISRSTIVLARYLTSGVITLLGILLWIIIATIADWIYSTSE